MQRFMRYVLIFRAVDEDGFYASDLIGFDIRADGMDIGHIADIDERVLKMYCSLLRRRTELLY